MLVSPVSATVFVISIYGIQVSSFTGRFVKLTDLAIQKKYRLIIKGTDVISKGLMKFHGTLHLTKLSKGAWPIHKELEIA